jgi:DNA-binding response OmpR family regulator
MVKNILIIEDDKFLRSLITEKVSSQGFNVSVAIDGKEGIREAQKSKPDLILLDLILPDVDGFEVLSKIKGEAGTSAVPVIVLSNLDSKEDIDKALKLGASDFLIKAQLTPEEIVEKVKNIFSAK